MYREKCVFFFRIQYIIIILKYILLRVTKSGLTANNAVVSLRLMKMESLYFQNKYNNQIFFSPNNKYIHVTCYIQSRTTQN